MRRRIQPSSVPRPPLFGLAMAALVLLPPPEAEAQRVIRRELPAVDIDNPARDPFLPNEKAVPARRLFSTAKIKPAPEPAPLREGEILLRWRNGDELPGRLLDGLDGRLRFAAAPFAAPFDLHPAQLSGVRFPPSKGQAAEGEGPLFEVSLRNGDRLRGQLLAVDLEHLLFRCAPLAAPVSIRRSETLRLARAGMDGGGFSGLGELDDWTSRGRDRKPADWFTDLRGELATHQWSGNLFREIALPQRVEVRFRARFPQGSPNVEVGLLREPQQGPMLETWERHLVLTHRSRFAPVMELTEETRELHLRLFWDQRSGKISVCDLSGKTLASLTGETGPENPDPGRRNADPLRRGFSILSRNPAMTLLSLEARPWDGGPVPLVDLTRPRLQLREGPARFRVEDTSLAPGSGLLRFGGETRPLGDLVEWVLSPETGTSPAPGGPGVGATRVAWFSGSSLSGDYLRMGGAEITLRPPWAAEPVTASLADAREIRFPESSEPFAAGADTLATGGSTLRGGLRLASPGPEGGASLLAWQPPGADAPVPFADDASVTVTRNLPADADSPAWLGQARLYLDNDEILTGDLVSLTPEKIVFESRVTGRVEVGAEHVRAIDIGTSGRVLDGFRDTEWEEIEEAEDEVQITPDSVIMRAGSFGNPSGLLGDRIRFDAEWKESYGAFTLRLFASGPDASHPSTDIVVAVQGSRLFVGKLNENGAFSFSGDQIPVTGNRASLDISTRPEEVEIHVNGKSTLTLKVDPEKVSGNGVYFKMGGGGQGWNQAGSTIAFSRFRIESSPGSVPRRVIDPRAKAQILAIPRSMRESVPTHLLVAPNGDLLRGTLASVQGGTLRFHANGETLEIPRSRVSSIVRLGPPLPPPPAKGEEEKEKKEEAPEEAVPINPFADEHYQELAAYNFRTSHRLILRDGTRLRLDGKGVEGNRLSGESAILGKCLVPLEQIREVGRTPPTLLHEAEPMDLVAFADWRSVFTPEPAIPEAGGAPSSPLVGKEAPVFELPLLDDSTFRLAEQRGRVVVLDFWATWSGPCIKAMPEVMEGVSAFPPGTVTYLAVNQGETPPLVTAFLEAREWQDTPVALDFNLKVGQSYQADSLPHTVVIDPEGKIAWVHSGFSPDLKRKLFEAIATALSK